MLDALAATQIALLHDQLSLQSINQNVTNMQTPGYKRQRIEYPPFDEQLSVEMASVYQQGQLTPFMRQGVLVQSRNPHHLSLSGAGFFVVQGKKGIFYTRRGDFHINTQGELATANGLLLLGQNGPLRVNDPTFTVDKQGSLFVDHKKVDQINIVQLDHIDQLKYLGQGLYTSRESPKLAANDTNVQQGFLEQSNVKSLDEMIELITISRHFEASQHIMRMVDRLLSKAINQLGESNV